MTATATTACDEVGAFACATVEETSGCARTLGGLLRPGDVVGLIGELGAGKTCFAQGVGQGIGVDSRYRVCSPTFTLINEYPARAPLIHADLYRLAGLDEMVEIGLFDYLGGEGVCLIEWFENMQSQAGEDYLRVRFVVTGEQSRRLEVAAAGERHRKLADQWITLRSSMGAG